MAVELRARASRLRDTGAVCDADGCPAEPGHRPALWRRAPEEGSSELSCNVNSARDIYRVT